MATTTPNMSLLKPAIDADSGTWDTSLNASIDLLDLHTHEPGQGVRVPTAGLNINADLTFAGNAATNLEAVAFAGVASYTTNKSLWVDSDDNELYWRSNAGTNVQITAGASLNLSLVGGITGDYAAAAASFYYDNTAKTYRALQEVPLPNEWASISAGDVDLYEKLSGITNRVRLSSPTGLAASYALTFPAALPASTVLVQASAAGALTFSSTLNTSLVMASGLHVTVSGAGEFKHGDRTLVLHAAAGDVVSGAAAIAGGATVAYWNASGAAEIVNIPVPLKTGDRIRSVTFYHQRAGGSMTFKVWRNDYSAGVTRAQIGSTQTISAGTSYTSTTDSGIDHTLLASNGYFIEWVSAAAGDRFYGCLITYDHP